MDDTDEKLLKDAQREAEKLEKAKAKQAAKLLKQEEKLAKKAERDAQKAVEKEEKRIAAEAKKALKAEQKAVKEEEKALKQAQKAVEKEIADENAAAVTVIEGDKLIKVKNRKDKETKKFTWWWNRKKSEASVIENEVQTTKRKWFRKGE